MTPYATVISVSLLLLCVPVKGAAQLNVAQPPASTDSLQNSGKQLLAVSLSTFTDLLNSKSIFDSTVIKKYKTLFTSIQSTSLKEKMQAAFSLPVPSKPASILRLQGGYVNYTYSFRSGIDTPVLEKNIGQHLVTSRLNALVANFLPVSITYFQRESNSGIFSNYVDVRVELNTQAFQQSQTEHLHNQLSSLPTTLRNPVCLPAMEASLKQLAPLQNWLMLPGVQKKYINAKELLLFSELVDSLGLHQHDSLQKEAQTFLALYDSISQQQKNYQNLFDSLQKAYIATEKKVQSLQRLISGDLHNPKVVKAIEDKLQAEGLPTPPALQSSNFLSSIRTFAIGKTTPNFSPLTLQNTNVRGINVEYNHNNFYGALAVGSVDLRVRDFVYSKQARTPQAVYAARLGYGQKEANHFIVTYYRGQKQLYSSPAAHSAQSISGISLEGQWLLAKHHRLRAELAQSAVPSLINTNGHSENRKLNFHEPNNRAYAVELNSYMPATQTRVEARYQHSGINFQSFTNYRVNAEQDNWSLKADQYLWKKRLHIVGALRTNDFSNPLVLQRYQANTIFKNITLTFHQRKWPTLSLGYMPSSQYTMVDSLVYENHYQVINATASHQYKLGLAAASTAVMYNRLYNPVQDSGFVYYNAMNLYVSQSFQFSGYTVNTTISHTDNGRYHLNVWEGGVLMNVQKENAVGFGVKINQLSTSAAPKLGLYSDVRMIIPRVGQFNVWLEQNYLPNSKGQLSKNEFFTIGFIRYFK